MAQVYGDRWQVIESLGKGAQGDVFRVKDLTEVISEECALKRLINLNRLSRFQKEIEAVEAWPGNFEEFNSVVTQAMSIFLEYVK